MTDKDRIKALEICLRDDQVSRLQRIKRGLAITVVTLGGCAILEGVVLAVLLYKTLF